ncbi:hypothetical protein TEA_003453 [Camellia sinensis var. sinensis]|uniref:23 kDa jasmonate-induced protein-like n=1 Tax=Camellia sinensis var. sinensis TaxID=542762 RepID=A0A4S4DSA9_CAMSN|nr:hypothetical protein TEA_003453 [Camellia sinensis var. sinensis]
MKVPNCPVLRLSPDKYGKIFLGVHWYSRIVLGGGIMANNVFGNPITNETLEAMPEYYKKEITPRDRAHVAMLMKNAENKDHNARNHVESRKKDFGDGISALCVIYNATGDALKFITTHDYHGHIYADPYPTIIQNGQWAAFLHVKPSVITAGSSAGVVYRGKNQSGEQHDWMLAWSIPYVGDNHVSKTFTDLSSHSWHCFLHYHGHIYTDPYPTIIQNGQWAAFLHVKPSAITAGSSAGVVYRGKNQSGEQHDWMLAWSIPYVGDNHAYTEIRGADHYKESNNRWGTVSDKMGNAGLTHEDNWCQCVSYASIGNNTSPMFEGIMTLEGA